MEVTPVIKCNFCGASGVSLVTGDNQAFRTYICEDCAQLACGLIADEKAKDAKEQS